MTQPSSATQINRDFDVESVRRDFPILNRPLEEGRRRKGELPVFLDSAASAQKPSCVIEKEREVEEQYFANAYRGVYYFGERIDEELEASRDRVRQLLNAESSSEIAFTSGTTMSINVVARAWGAKFLQPGDEVLITEMEHHANIVPWQLVCERTGASLRVVELAADGSLDMDDLRAKLTGEVKLLAFTHVSNVLGTVNPVAEICRLARKQGVVTLVDGSQALPHRAVDIPLLGCDFYAFTGHKMLGPTGTGGLWARRQHLREMPPFLGGGEMIKEVRFEGTTFNDAPHKFEAGTPNIAGVVGLGAAADYLSAIGMAEVEAREQALLAIATQRLSGIEGLRILGTAPGKAAVISFLVDGAHAHDLATLLDLEGIAVRSGHHCAHPLMAHYGVPATCRASLAFYNTEAEVEKLAAGIEKVRKLLL